MRNALAGNLGPSLTACNTRPRWQYTRWLISVYSLIALCLQAWVWELVYWWSLGYWPPITILGDLSPDLSAAWSVGDNLVTDHRSPLLAIVPLPLCHLVHVSPCEWSTWFSNADVIDYRWPIGSETLEGGAIPWTWNATNLKFYFSWGVYVFLFLWILCFGLRQHFFSSSGFFNEFSGNNFFFRKYLRSVNVK